jgi:hypothetical protein
MTGTAANVQEAQHRRGVHGRWKVKRQHKIAPDVGLGPCGDFAGVVSGAELEQNSLERIAKQPVERHGQ